MKFGRKKYLCLRCHLKVISNRDSNQGIKTINGMREMEDGLC